MEETQDQTPGGAQDQGKTVTLDPGQLNPQSGEGSPDLPEASPLVPSPGDPQTIGRYRVVRVLGRGGFGRVYLAQDDDLKRPVAVKVPHPERISRPEDVEAYLAEARILAGLDHPNIVPAYDVGRTDNGLCYVVSKYVEGSDLAARIRQGRTGFHESAGLVAVAADALHYSHTRGLVHRDIKPANILIDVSGKPYVADFGLALRAEDFGKGARLAGTPSYMSPEQARGEGHRVDGRSDIFSLGVVFYELLTGQRPFRGETAQLLDQIRQVEARPPRQIDDTIPKELERICLKALSKRATERYPTAKDMAEDLHHYLAEAPLAGGYTVVARPGSAPGRTTPPTEDATPIRVTPVHPETDRGPIRVIPKGLRSFDAHDADFFLELLPGPRDRDGLPESIRYWKTRIEETDPDETFRVGLIYGPSGCGKSSLVKAGLLPRLARHVLAIYVEATAEETEARLLRALRKQCPELPSDLGMVDSLAALRRGGLLPDGKKVVLVLDQFEQWLHARRGEEETELVAALRQCDGEHVQAVVLVRDDFWLAMSRFMRDLEIRLLEGENSALVDLFDTRHATSVLTAFGRAYGALPERPSEVSADQRAFVAQSVSSLAEDGKVISVRLALLAEMVKGKPWTPATLREVGGTQGVGVTFLEETFSASKAPPEHRLHQKAAQAVLKTLLPETGNNIKGEMRSEAELREASGYGDLPRDFDELICILDAELRLITPTDPEGSTEDGRAINPIGGRYYQFTHDYLVPSLREWLTRKQRESARGRAELLLADRTAVWNARPENRQLPSLLQWWQIRWLTARNTWTPSQRRMMDKGGRFHAARGLLLVVVLAMIGYGGVEGYGTLRAHALRERLLDATTIEVPTIVHDMAPYRHWLDRLLHEAQVKAERDSDRRRLLHTSLALLQVDTSQVDYLYHRLLSSEPGEFAVIRDALFTHKNSLAAELWAVVAAPEKGKESKRLRAAAALAKFDPKSEKWSQFSPLVVDDLVRENPVFLLYWSEAFRPVKESLQKPLAGIFGDQRPERAAERSLATNLLADYASDQPRVLADLLMDSDEQQFAVILAKFKEQGESICPLLTGEIDKKLPTELPSADVVREKLSKRQANAAVALLRMNRTEKVWPLLKHSHDPRARSYLTHRLGPQGADAETIIKRLDEESDITIRRALLLSLGEFTETELAPTTRTALLPEFQELYRNHSDPGLHSATEWLLRRWRQQVWLEKVNEKWAADQQERHERLDRIRRLVEKDKQTAAPQWYVNGQGQTMVVIPGPVEFSMGSPPTEADRRPDEIQHKRRTSRTFAIAAMPVSKEQFLRFLPTFTFTEMRLYPDSSCPIGGVTWYEAASYCNWLSMQEGITEDQWCYDTNPQGEVTRMKDNHRSLTGYRLPSEAELEYATRAGAQTSRCYGETEELLGKYGWYFKNSEERTWPLGSKKPNDLGLFDVHGNVWCWCQDNFEEYPKAEAGKTVWDNDGTVDIRATDNRVMRGGSFSGPASIVRSAYRGRNMPSSRFSIVGFRPSKTLLP